MSIELLESLAKKDRSSFFSAIRVLQSNDLSTRTARIVAQETLQCGAALATRLLDSPEDPDNLSKAQKVLDEALSLSERLLASGTLVKKSLLCKLYYSLSQLAKLTDRLDDHILHLQQALEISDQPSQTMAMQLLLAEALVETKNFRAAKFLAEKILDQVRIDGKWLQDVWQALHYVIVLSLILQISLALNDRSAAKLYVDLALAVRAVAEERWPKKDPTTQVAGLVTMMERFMKRFSNVGR